MTHPELTSGKSSLAPPESSEVIKRTSCAYCLSEIEGTPEFRCPACETGYHEACWQENDGCSLPGCSGTASSPATPAPTGTLQPLPASPQQGATASSTGTPQVPKVIQPITSPRAPSPSGRALAPSGASVSRPPSTMGDVISASVQSSWSTREIVLASLIVVGLLVGMLGTRHNWWPAITGRMYTGAQKAAAEDLAFTTGEDQGYARGEQAGYSRGESDGYSQGVDDGREQGYGMGYRAGCNSVFDRLRTTRVVDYWDWYFEIGYPSYLPKYRC